MTGPQIAQVLVSLAVLIGAAHVVGWGAVRLRQPRFVGEILAGVLLGPFVLGRVAPSVGSALLGRSGDPTSLVLEFASWLGLLLLMFVSGAAVRGVLAPEQRRATVWILSLGTAVPFAIALGVGGVLPLDDLQGPRGGEAALLVVIATAAAVTSIPVISRIFFDLKILHTRFASLILGTAMLEDVALFGALAVATALARGDDGGLAVELATHIPVTVAYLVIGLLVAPRLLDRVHDFCGDTLARRVRPAYAMVLLFGYVGVGGLLEVNVVFGSFLAGFGLVGGFGGRHRDRFAGALDSVSRIGFATFIPVYFALVGARLDLGVGFSLPVLLAFLVGSSLLRISFVTAASRLAAISPRDAVDVGIAMNARGGPGIVLATVAFEAGIIAPSLFSALVITAIATSQVAGWWLGRAIRDRGELLGEPVGMGNPGSPKSSSST
ncbi:MAG: cation:proton antiporter [Chloroflexota bacterium]